MDLSKIYEPQKIEEKILKFWERGGFFRSKIVKGKKPFVITLPPPNVTGNLHAGHAMYVVEDIMARQKRMQGVPTLWLPGFDHASIAVEYLVSKQLKKEGLTKQGIGREEFLKRAMDFAVNSRKTIKNQLQKLGFSLDWSREAYTMDEKRSVAVKEAFKRLYQKGLIYQGEYIINWCPGCKTAISDLENEYREEIGKLYYIKYGPLTIATTRPETMFADVAVAIHPDNKKYQRLVGQLVPLPLTSRKIPVIEDAGVDPNFGTGALKITPGHDELDFEIGQRHNLEKLQAVGFNGRLTAVCGPDYEGLSVSEGREKAVAELQAQGLIEKIEEYKHSVGHCQRCGSRTEPLVSKQWFIKTKALAEKAIKAVKTGQTKIVPKRFEKVYFHWLKNIRDWCISRQLWWGHRIPLKGVEDTLDTWFSSSLWPISTLGWPQNTPDFKYFYPTTVRETGYDILFFWVAREMMMCLEMTGISPFKVIYLHGLVRDQIGRKFSKTAGIGLDPLDMTQKYGTDALRMALIYGNAAGMDLKIGEDKIRAMRNFTNKIWNASRFVLANRGRKAKTFVPSSGRGMEKRKAPTNKDDQWILKELEKTIKKVNELMEKYRYGQVAELIYQFFWKKFCDKYIESTKDRREQVQPILLHVLSVSLKLLHPFMPFITEEIWQKLPARGKRKSISLENWPKP
jgi:valyl-tRNA synthetase